MAKTNFTKVEEVLTEGMRKIEVDRLLDIADRNMGKDLPQSAPKVTTFHLKRLSTVYHDLVNLDKQGKNPYVNLNINKEEIKKFVDNPKTLSPQDWEKIKEIKNKIEGFKSKEKKDEDLIEKERKSQTNKRFNVNDKWIPLK
jgi:hypothetical protein